MLVRRGARIDAKGVQSYCTPLHSAAAGGHLGACCFVLDIAPSFAYIFPSEIGVVALLLSLGARLNSFTQAGWSPMHSCALRYAVSSVTSFCFLRKLAHE
jgi:ankyrin repeat protein